MCTTSGVIERGDVVVFWYPLDRSKSFIKRVVGLPGDLVEIRQGRVFINGKQLDEPYVPAEYVDSSDYAPLRVRLGEYFVMGDHRISSNDSRMFGPVAASLHLRQGRVCLLADGAIRFHLGHWCEGSRAGTGKLAAQRCLSRADIETVFGGEH